MTGAQGPTTHGVKAQGLLVRGLSVAYDGQTVLRELSMTVGEPGNLVTAILGPSGCGKSTVIAAIAGIVAAPPGTIAFDGRDITATPIHRRDFGVVFQRGQLLPGKSVASNVAYGLRARRVPRASIAPRIGELLELVGLDGYADRNVGELSGGQVQRVALARALAPRPRMLLLDEPFSALDRGLRERLTVDVGDILRSTQTPTLVVTHDHAEAATLADQIAVMTAGTVAQQAQPRHVWDYPVSDEVALLVGCTQVLPIDDGTVPSFGRIGDDRAATATAIGLRAQSVRIGGTGVLGRVRSVTELPDGLIARITLADGLVVAAITTTPVAVGDEVRVSLDPDSCAFVGA